MRSATGEPNNNTGWIKDPPMGGDGSPARSLPSVRARLSSTKAEHSTDRAHSPTPFARGQQLHSNNTGLHRTRGCRPRRGLGRQPELCSAHGLGIRPFPRR